MDRDRRPPTLPPILEPPVYGDARRPWSPEFVAYAHALVERPEYAGMPCTHAAPGRLDWIIPSGRRPGSTNADGPRRRTEWWAKRAPAFGISPSESKWISRTAKALHPWGWKPCQTCGRWMRLTYAYPTARALDKLNASMPVGTRFDWHDHPDIYEVGTEMAAVLGTPETIRAFKGVFRPLAPVSDSATLDELLDAVEERLVRAENRLLSPGAMSNAPDRLDGFHTYNLCCRKSQDTGRSAENLRTYTVDRRAFEYWAEGDWVSANALMGATSEGRCARCGNHGRLTADHVGPISLGFRHAPFFEPLCASCNSAKNNRMDMRDVETLLELERAASALIGGNAASWQVRDLWDAGKVIVQSDADALRLSKLLGVAQHTYLGALVVVRGQAPDALVQLLHPEYATAKPVFIDLDPTTLRHHGVRHESRPRAYALSQATRLVRIAFESLDQYRTKEHRNVPAIPPELMATQARALAAAAERAGSDPSSWRPALVEALASDSGAATVREGQLRRLIEAQGFFTPTHDYSYVIDALHGYMSAANALLITRLDDDRDIKRWHAGD